MPLPELPLGTLVSQRGPTMPRWTWLFPLTYILHASEELFAGEHFYIWISRVAGADLSRADFLTINAVALTAMTLAVVAINTSRNARWLVATFGFIVALNGSLHVIGSIVSASYSPGTGTGIAMWLPLGIYALGWSWRLLPRKEFSAAIFIGVVIHVGVITLAMTI